MLRQDVSALKYMMYVPHMPQACQPLFLCCPPPDFLALSVPVFCCVQRSFIGNPAFSVFQEIDLSGPEPTVANVVDFGKYGEIKIYHNHIFGLFGGSYTDVMMPWQTAR